MRAQINRRTTPTPPRELRGTGRPAPSGGIAIVTMTWARDPAEADRLERAVRTLCKIGLPIYVGDGGSDPSFIRSLKRLPNLELCPRDPTLKPTLVNQLRCAFARAEEIHPDYFLYTEPDKRAFFRSGLSTLCKAAASRPVRPPELLIAARNRRSVASFPKGQQIAESVMNRLCGEALGQPGDYTYGPMLIRSSLLRDAPPIPENLGWGWRFFLIAVAHQLRRPIVLRTVGSQCPVGQRAEDDGPARSYRLRQLIENVTGLANGWTALLDHPMPNPTALVAAA